MAANKPPSDALLNQAAELRAGGSTWDAVAAELHRSVETVRKWPTAYAALWQPVLRAAERRQAIDSAAEAILILRQLLRSKDEAVRRDAARWLISLRLDQAKLDERSPDEAASAGLSSEAKRVVAFLDGQPDDKLEHIAATLRRFAAGQPVRGPKGTGAGA